MKKVMLILSSGAVGGAEETVYLLAKGLEPTRFQVSVVSPEGPMAERFRRLPDVQWFKADFSKFPSITDMRHLTDLILEVEPDIVHSQLFHADLYTFLATRSAKLPVVLSTVQGVNFFWEMEQGARRFRWFFSSLISRWIYRFFDGVATCSDAVKEAIATRPGFKVKRDKIRTIYNAFQAKPAGEAHQTSPQEKTIVHVANFAAFKGHQVLLEALAKMSEPAQCLLIGDGPERARMEALATSLNVQDRVQFLGTRDDVSQLLQKADVFAFPSLWEPFGIALVEAMSQGVPVVAANAGGVKEIVSHEQNGLLVEPGNAEDLAAALERLLNDAELSDRLASSARKDLDRFSVDQLIQAHTEWYESICL